MVKRIVVSLLFLSSSLFAETILLSKEKHDVDYHYELKIELSKINTLTSNTNYFDTAKNVIGKFSSSKKQDSISLLKQINEELNTINKKLSTFNKTYDDLTKSKSHHQTVIYLNRHRITQESTYYQRLNKIITDIARDESFELIDGIKFELAPILKLEYYQKSKLIKKEELPLVRFCERSANQFFCKVDKNIIILPAL